MTFDERVRALALLGFSERQTRFLVTVALHSGFCLRRQYVTFAGLKYGAGVRDFLDRLVTRKLATRSAFRRDRGHVYHLHSSAIYDPIDQADNRNRRTASAALIARKLMVLDYVLEHPAVEWFATEADKVHLFASRFGIRPIDLPQRIYVARRREASPTVRHFVHKLPIFVKTDSPAVSFVWLVTETSGEAFEQFIHDHIRLLSHLPDWRVVAVAPRHIPGLPACAPALDRVVRAVMRSRTSDECDALREYFTTLDQLERNVLNRVSNDDVNRFYQLRARFATNEFEVLFERWKLDRTTDIADRGGTGFAGALRHGRGMLVTEQLPHSYDRFGTRAGVS